jgi:hypothetical protein
MPIGIWAVVTVAVAFLPGDLFGQSKSDRRVKLVTVCELLRDLQKYTDKDLAILGRLDCGHSLTDNPCFLTEDRCERPITTEGYVWPNKVAITGWEEGVAKPPSEVPQIDQPTLIEKLSLVRKNTKLGLHREPQFKTEGRTVRFSHFADTKDEWGIAYGRVFSAKLQNEPCGDEIGCGGFGGAPVGLIIGTGILNFKDEDYPNRTPEK